MAVATITASASGQYEATFTATDIYNRTASVRVPVRVLEPLILSLSASTGWITEQGNTSITLSTQNAEGAVTFTCTENGTTTTITGNTAVITAQTPGTYTITFIATDSYRRTAEKSFTLTVLETLRITAAPSSVWFDKGGSTSLTLTATGGTGVTFSSSGTGLSINIT